MKIAELPFRLVQRFIDGTPVSDLVAGMFERARQSDGAGRKVDAEQIQYRHINRSCHGHDAVAALRMDGELRVAAGDPAGNAGW